MAPIPARKNVGEPRFELFSGSTYNDQFEWHWRRALKVGKTTHPQDFVRAYETMPAGIYQHNIEARQHPAAPGGRGGHLFIAVENLDSSVQPRRVVKRQSLGSEAAKRRKRSFARNFEEGTRILEGYEAQRQATQANGHEVVQDSNPRMDFENTGPTGEINDKDLSRRIARVRFQDEEEDDWTDVENIEVGDFLKDGGGVVISTVPEEYVLV